MRLVNCWYWYWYYYYCYCSSRTATETRRVEFPFESCAPVQRARLAHQTASSWRLPRIENTNHYQLYQLLLLLLRHLMIQLRFLVLSSVVARLSIRAVGRQTRRLRWCKCRGPPATRRRVRNTELNPAAAAATTTANRVAGPQPLGAGAPQVAGTPFFVLLLLLIFGVHHFSHWHSQCCW